MAWVGIAVSIAFAVVGELIRPKQAPPNARASSLDDLELPTAEEGRSLYAFAGKVRIDAPNVVWYGDLEVRPITKKVKTGWFSSAKQTIGHQYKMGMAIAIAFARDDMTLHKILFGTKEPKHTVTNEGNGCYLWNYQDSEFYGGETSEGGVAGPIRVYMGTDTQTSNAYMTAQLGQTYPPYRKLMHAVCEHFWWGNTGYLKPLSWELSSYPNQLGLPSNHHIIGVDANPACMIYELLTEQLWAAGIPTTDVNAANFAAIGEQLYTEGLGMSMVYSGTATTRENIAEILRHIDGVMFTNPSTGLLELAIARADYDIDDLPILTRDDFTEAGIKFSRPSWEETKNTLKITYTDRDKDYTTAVISMQDLANVMIRNEITPETIEFEGFSHYEPAAWAAARSLKALSYPSATIEGAVLRRAGASLAPAAVVRVMWPELGLNGNVFRITDVSYPGVNTNEVPLKMVEDVFSVAAVPYTEPPPSGWEDPAKPPVAVARQQLFELPYQFTGNTGMYVATLASRAQPIDMGYRIWSGSVSGDVNLSFKDETNDWTPSALINVAYPDTTADIDATGFTVSDVRHGEEIPATVSDDVMYAGDSIGLISSSAGDELVAFKNFTGTAFTQIIRGVYGTGKLNHPTGATFWILSGGFGMENDSPYTTLPRTVFAKYLTFNALGSLAIASATQMSLALTGKASMPAAPRYARLNGSTSLANLGAGVADATLTWEWKDLAQAGGRITLPGSGSDPLPAGTTFTVQRIVNGTPVATTTGLTAFTTTYTQAQQNADAVSGTQTLVFRIWAVNAAGVAGPYTSFSTNLVRALTFSLLHFNGTAGTNTITNSSIVPGTWTARDVAVLTTAQIKFGSASLRTAGTGDGARSDTMFSPGTGNWTHEFFVRVDAYPAGGQWFTFIDLRSSGADAQAIEVDIDSSGYLGLVWNNAFQIKDTVGFPTGQFVHVAAVREGSTVRLFKNGVMVGQATYGAGAMGNRTISVGLAYDNNWSTTGYFDEVRSSYTARYTGTSSFTPPTAEFTPD